MKGPEDEEGQVETDEAKGPDQETQTHDLGENGAG